MRLISGLFLVALITVAALLTYENNTVTRVNAWTWNADVPLPVLVGGVYLLGMVSGWWMVGLLKRSWQRVTEPDRAAV